MGEKMVMAMSEAGYPPHRTTEIAEWIPPPPFDVWQRAREIVGVRENQFAWTCQEHGFDMCEGIAIQFRKSWWYDPPKRAGGFGWFVEDPFGFHTPEKLQLEKACNLGF